MDVYLLEHVGWASLDIYGLSAREKRATAQQSNPKAKEPFPKGTSLEKGRFEALACSEGVGIFNNVPIDLNVAIVYLPPFCCHKMVLYLEMADGLLSG